MRRAVLFLLLAAFLSTGVTGLFADVLGIERSLYHSYSAYALAVLTFLHIYLNRRALLSRLSWWARKGGERKQAMPSPAKGGVKWNRRTFLLATVSAVAGFALGRWLPLAKPPSLEGGEDLGKLYHQWSKPGALAFLRRPLEWGLPPPRYKEYPNLPLFPLPKGSDYQELTVKEAIQRRRSIRDFAGAIPLGKLSSLLHAAGGITEPRNSLRAAPSAGALYPIEIYPIVLNVEGLMPGVYHYAVREHALTRLKEGDFRFPLFHYCVGQKLILGAGAVIALTGIFQRTRWKYRDRHYRYIILEAGHIGQNIYLQATSLGLGTCAIGAFLDDDINRLLEVDGEEEAVLYLLALGVPAL